MVGQRLYSPCRRRAEPRETAAQLQRQQISFFFGQVRPDLHLATVRTDRQPARLPTLHRAPEIHPRPGALKAADPLRPMASLLNFDDITVDGHNFATGTAAGTLIKASTQHQHFQTRKGQYQPCSDQGESGGDAEGDCAHADKEQLCSLPGKGAVGPNHKPTIRCVCFMLSGYH